MANPVAATGSDHGRHRRPHRRAVVVVTTVAALLGTVSVSAAAFNRGPSTGSGGCPTTRTLRVQAAPEVAPAVEKAARSVTGVRCLRIAVSAADPAGTAAELARRTARVDVWVPDSSMWVSTSTRAAGTPPAAPTSIAYSPVVLALPERSARRLGPHATYEQIAAAATSPHPITLQSAAPADSATSQAALIDLGASLSSTSAQRGQLAALVRSMEATSAGDLPASVASHGTAVAVATTERAVRAANRAAGRVVYRAIRPAVTGTSMDYPYVVLSTDPRMVAAAQALLDGLTGPDGAASLEKLGFRTGWDGVTSPALTAAESDAALSTLAVVDQPSRALALVDVSGSMALPVPGAAGTTRMDLARAAIGSGMALLPEGTVAGLWRFSANLTPSTDYEQLVPLTPLTRQSRGRFAAAVRGLDVDADGGTGLYSSTLAAVRYVRAEYDATRVNSVVVLSDGKDQDASAHGISLHTLLATLRAENDPKRPVIVITIAYGPDSDTAAMRAISATTGGTLYTARDPRDLPMIVREAIGHRLCTTAC
jgi:Ca-activated chloride channel family protein